MDNRFIESFNGRLRDECLNVEVFLSIPDAQAKLERWRMDYNQQRPHRSLRDQTPQAFALASEGKERRGTHVSRVSVLEPPGWVFHLSQPENPNPMLGTVFRGRSVVPSLT